MEKHEVTKVMAILSAFYGQGKSDPETMATAWWYILSPYDYNAAQRAVIKFAKNDMREYATFPAPGVLVDLIEKEGKLHTRVFNAMYMGKPYDELTEEESALIDEETYNWGLSQDPEYLLSHKDNFIEKTKQLALGGANSDQQ